jgi:hypothetical protein
VCTGEQGIWMESEIPSKVEIPALEFLSSNGIHWYFVAGMNWLFLV